VKRSGRRKVKRRSTKPKKSTLGGRKVLVKSHTRHRRGPNHGRKTVKQRTTSGGTVRVRGYARKKPRGS
jgi:hypothetical protein